MHRRGYYAIIFAVMSVVFAAEAARILVNGVHRIRGIGVPADLVSGLIAVGCAAMFFVLAWRFFLLARQRSRPYPVRAVGRLP